MKKMLLFVCLFSSIQAFCGNPIDLVESTIKVAGLGEEVFYLGFAEGDQLIFNFEELNGKELKELEIIELPGTSRFMDYKSKKITDKILNIQHTGIYKFRFQNTSLAARICKYKIQRIPASPATQNFNTSVYWKTVYDTSYYTVQENYIISKAYAPKTIVTTTDFYINGGLKSTVGSGKSRVTIPLQLPANTVAWYYQFSAYRDKAAIEKTKQLFDLAAQLSRLIERTGTAKIAIEQLTQPPGADYCDVYLIDFDNLPRFEAKDQFPKYPAGTRENVKSGIVRIDGKPSFTPVIGLRNPDSYYGVNVVLECVAIVYEEQTGTRDVKKMNITSKQAPYLNN